MTREAVTEGNLVRWRNAGAEIVIEILHVVRIEAGAATPVLPEEADRGTADVTEEMMQETDKAIRVVKHAGKAGIVMAVIGEIKAENLPGLNSARRTRRRGTR